MSTNRRKFEDYNLTKIFNLVIKRKFFILAASFLSLGAGLFISIFNEKYYLSFEYNFNVTPIFGSNNCFPVNSACLLANAEQEIIKKLNKIDPKAERWDVSRSVRFNGLTKFETKLNIKEKDLEKKINNLNLNIEKVLLDFDKKNYLIADVVLNEKKFLLSEYISEFNKTIDSGYIDNFERANLFQISLAEKVALRTLMLQKNNIGFINADSLTFEKTGKPIELRIIISLIFGFILSSSIIILKEYLKNPPIKKD